MDMNALSASVVTCNETGGAPFYTRKELMISVAHSNIISISTNASGTLILSKKTVYECLAKGIIIWSLG